MFCDVSERVQSTLNVNNLAGLRAFVKDCMPVRNLVNRVDGSMVRTVSYALEY